MHGNSVILVETTWTKNVWPEGRFAFLLYWTDRLRYKPPVSWLKENVGCGILPQICRNLIVDLGEHLRPLGLQPLLSPGKGFQHLRYTTRNSIGTVVCRCRYLQIKKHEGNNYSDYRRRRSMSLQRLMKCWFFSRLVSTNRCNLRYVWPHTHSRVGRLWSFYAILGIQHAALDTVRSQR